MHRVSTCGITLVLGLLSSAPLNAQDSAFGYQGRLKIAGQPINGTADLRFSLFTAVTGGSQTGTTQSFSGVAVADGLIALELDFGFAPWEQGDPRFLQIEVRTPAGSGAFTTLAPRQNIAAVPYAIKTLGLSVDEANDRVRVGLEDPGARVGIGLDDPAAPFHLRGRGTAYGNHVAVIENEGGGTPDGLAIKLDGGGLTRNNNFITFIDAADNVAGRIEGFNASRDWIVPPPIPSLVRVDFDPGRLPNLAFNGGRLPNIAFSRGRLPDFDARGGVFPTFAFNPGSFPMPSWNPGTQDTFSFTPGTLPTINFFTGTFHPGSLPSASFNAGNLPTFSLSGGSLPSGSMIGGSFPDFDFDAGALPDLLLDPGALPDITFDGGTLPGVRGLRLRPPTQAELTALYCWAREHGMDTVLGFLLPAALDDITGANTIETMVRTAATICQDQGVVYASKGADYAEWLPKEDPAAKFQLGQVVGVRGGKISLRTSDAEQLLVISAQPVVLGNVPPAGAEAQFEKVAFMGQVPVLARGRVLSGDYLIPSGLDDGTVLAVDPERLDVQHLGQIVGRAWSASEGDVLGFVNLAVGLDHHEMARVMRKERERSEKQAAKVRELREQNERLSSRVAELAELQEELLERLEAVEANCANSVHAERR